MKEWGTIHEPPIRTLADRLDAGRPSRFSRRSRQPTTPDEERTVARAVLLTKRGDAEGLRYLYLRYADNVYGYVRSIVRDDHEAEDVTQLVFAKLPTALARYEPQAVPFSRWLLRLAHNASVDHLRSARSTPVEEVFGLEEHADDALGERLQALRAALAGLPADQREVVVLRHVLGLTPAEIAERMGRTTGSVHSLHHRGRGALRAALADLGAAPMSLRRAA